MHQNDLKTIDIYIAGRSFPVEVQLDEVESVNDLTATLNKKIADFQASYPGRDKIDYVIMTMLSHTYELHKSSVANADADAAVFHKIQEIKSVMDQF